MLLRAFSKEIGAPFGWRQRFDCALRPQHECRDARLEIDPRIRDVVVNRLEYPPHDVNFRSLNQIVLEAHRLALFP
jgi:hypothetical protein